MTDQKFKPPSLARGILSLFLNHEHPESMLGDYEEIYHKICEEKSVIMAKLWFILQILVIFPSFLRNSFYFGGTMIKNYLKVAFRNIKRHKGYSFINITGLALGMACVVLIGLIIQYHFGFDDFHLKKDRIYRIFTETIHSGSKFVMAPVMLPLAPILEKDLEEVKYAVRVIRKNQLVSSGEKHFYEGFHYADAKIFEVLTFPFLRGDSSTALRDPYSLVISELLARKYFGSIDVIGEVLTFNKKHNYKITGVLKEIPKKSHLDFNMLASMCTLNPENYPQLTKWTSFSNDYTYILLKPGFSLSQVQTKFRAILDKYGGKEETKDYTLYLQKLKNIHFSEMNYDNARTVPKAYLYVFFFVALFILINACMNFINLSTARSLSRAREVGLRKTFGAIKKQLIKQFLSESNLISFLAMVQAIVLVQLFLPMVNQLTALNLSFNPVKNWQTLIMVIAFPVIIGTVAGIYPAFGLSSFRVVNVLRGSMNRIGSKHSIRTVLVIIQFSVSIFLIIGTLTVYQQLVYMKNKDLGLKADYIIVLPVQNTPLKSAYLPFKNHLIQNPAIIKVSGSNGTPASNTTSSTTFKAEDIPGHEGVYMNVIASDHDFYDTYGIKVIQGRNFSRRITSDKKEAILINETAARKFGWTDPIGKFLLEGKKRKGQIIGVVKDFHYSSLRTAITPTLFSLDTREKDFIKFISIQIDKQNVAKSLNYIKSTFARFAPGFPFSHYFVDQRFQEYYRFEESLGKFLLYCTFLAVFVSGLGMFGLVSHSTQRRKKEIGIRKVLGASTISIVSLISKDYLKFAMIASLFTLPGAYFAMKFWLTGFAYRIYLSWEIFLVTVILALTIALLTVIQQSIKAGLMNPVDNLRVE
jgi:putative ABC transport system permease protein